MITMAKKPLFSIVMTNHNYGRYIGEAIRSVLGQSYRNWELVIVDDGSSDDSLDKIRPFLRDRRIRLFRNRKKQGLRPRRGSASKDPQARS